MIRIPHASFAPVLMIVPTCSPRSVAAVSLPGTRSPFTICTRSRWRATPMMSRSARSNGSDPLLLCEIGRVRLGRQFTRFLSVRVLRIGIVHAVDVLHDREARRRRARSASRKGAGVGAVRGAGASPGTHDGDREEKRCPRDRARAADRWIASWFCDRTVLDVGHAFRRQQGGQDVAILTGFACGQRRGEEPTGRPRSSATL